MNMQNRNNYTPDVLDCLANLSNDEVFTPPTVVNQMLDMLPQEVFMSKDTTFLDPFTKSGVFLREITKRLLENQIPDYKKTSDEIEIITKEAIQNAVRSGSLDLDDKDYEDKARSIGDAALKSHPDANKYLNFEIDLRDALDHILKNQVFGIAITELTAQLSRRSLYCSKDASSRYSVANVVFGANADGNIRFEPMKHTWDKANQDGSAQSGASCKYCGASASNLDRPDDLESHAYEFIHKDIADIRKEFGNMEFTVVCGNPPYQLSTTADTTGRVAATQASPVFNKFVEQAKRLNPKYLTMIIPARWYTGGIGLDAFRQSMFGDKHLSKIVDYPNSMDCFSGVAIAGGICYFLWDRDYNDTVCEVTNIIGSDIDTLNRDLSEPMFIRNNKAVSIFNKVMTNSSEFIEDMVYPLDPFGFKANERGDENKGNHNVELISSGGIGYIDDTDVVKNHDLIGKYKVTIGKVVPSNGEVGIDPSKGYKAITTPKILTPNQIHTFSYMLLGVFDDESTAMNYSAYICSKFARFMLRLTYSSMNISKSNFMYVPKMDYSMIWTDDMLYSHFGLTDDEILYIESLIRPME